MRGFLLGLVLGAVAIVGLHYYGYIDITSILNKPGKSKPGPSTTTPAANNNIKVDLIEVKSGEGGASAIEFVGGDQFLFVLDTKCDKVIPTAPNCRTDQSIDLANANGLEESYFGLLTADFSSSTGTTERMPVVAGTGIGGLKPLHDLEAACVLSDPTQHSNDLSGVRFLAAESRGPKFDTESRGRIFEAVIEKEAGKYQAKITHAWKYVLPSKPKGVFVIEGMACREDNASGEIEVWLSDRAHHNILGDGYPDIERSGVYYSAIERSAGVESDAPFARTANLRFGPDLIRDTVFLSCANDIIANSGEYSGISDLGDHPSQRSMSTLFMNFDDYGDIVDAWSAATVDDSKERRVCSTTFSVCNSAVCNTIGNTPDPISLYIPKSGPYLRELANDRVEGITKYTTEGEDGKQLHGVAYAIDNDKGGSKLEVTKPI